MIPFSNFKSRNLFYKTEEFGDPYWTAFDTSITPNSTTDPLGGSTGFLWLDNSASSAHYIRIDNSTAIPEGTYNYSIYARAFSADRYLGLAGFGIAGSGEVPIFNLNTGTVDLGATSVIVKSATIASVGGGWYRCSCVVQISVTATAGTICSIALPNSSTNNTVSGYSYAGTGTKGVYIWGAQLTEGAALLPYLKN